LVIGRASNVVFSDDGFDGAVIFCGAWKELAIDGQMMTVSAGVSLASAATRAQEAGLAGLEFAHGIPATVGGAVFMNAGAYGGSIADVCVKTEYFDPVDGTCHTVCGADHAFAYRNSIYKKNPAYTVLSATLALTPDNDEAIAARMKEYMQRRRSTQPLEYPSAGSVFKRPEGYFAGKLIEDAGLKGTRIGGAEVSEKHAGFIVNRGGATARDVRALVELIQARVLECFGVELECEICFL
jgi:UDP-N-acetylmuramate dehydrogenase